MVTYLKASVNEKTYSDYLWAAREANKEEAMEPSCSQPVDKPCKPKAVSFFPLQKLKGTQPTNTPTMRAVHLEEEGSDKEADATSKDPDGINDMMEEFIACLDRAVKETQQEEKCCYHGSSKEHFICKCPLVKITRSATHLNWKEGMVLEKGAQAPQVTMAKPKAPQEGMPNA